MNFGLDWCPVAFQFEFIVTGHFQQTNSPLDDVAAKARAGRFCGLSKCSSVIGSPVGKKASTVVALTRDERTTPASSATARTQPSQRRAIELKSFPVHANVCDREHTPHLSIARRCVFFFNHQPAVHSTSKRFVTHRRATGLVKQPSPALRATRTNTFLCATEAATHCTVSVAVAPHAFEESSQLFRLARQGSRFPPLEL